MINVGEKLQFLKGIGKNTKLTCFFRSPVTHNVTAGELHPKHKFPSTFCIKTKKQMYNAEKRADESDNGASASWHCNIFAMTETLIRLFF